MLVLFSYSAHSSVLAITEAWETDIQWVPYLMYTV